jgi:hypothetical protein
MNTTLWLPLRLPSAALLLTATVLFSAHPIAAEILWRGDFETGTTEQWRGTATKNDRVKVVTDLVRAGRYALQIDGTNAARRGDRDRIELQHQPKPPGTAEGTERYFGWSVFLPKKLTDEPHALGYFEVRNRWTQLMSFEVRGEDILYTTRVPYARRWTGTGRLTPGRWHDFALHVLWSREPSSLQSSGKLNVKLLWGGPTVEESETTVGPFAPPVPIGPHRPYRYHTRPPNRRLAAELAPVGEGRLLVSFGR